MTNDNNFSLAVLYSILLTVPVANHDVGIIIN